MNPLIIFDYCFYVIANRYKSIYVLGHQKEFAGVFLLSLLQIMNIDTIIMLLFSIKFASIYFVFGYLLLLVFNFIRYKKIITYSNLNDKWNAKSYLSQVLIKTLVFIYFVFSFVCVVIVSS